MNNNVEKNNYTDRTKDNIKKHRFGFHTDILNSFENKKNSKFNFKKMLIKDFEQKIKKREKIKDKLNLPKKKTLILGNIFNDNVDLNTIDNIVKTDPNQVIHIKKKIKNQNNKKEHQLLTERNVDNKKNLIKKINISKNIKYISKVDNKEKININKNKKIIQSIYGKNLNKTTNNFNISNSSINKLNQKYNNIIESMTIQQEGRNSNNMHKNNFINNKNNKPLYSNIETKPNVTIKNTVINLNIDTGFILQSFDKNNKSNQINKISNCSINDRNTNNKIYEIQNKNNKNLNNDTIYSNINHHNTIENINIKHKKLRSNFLKSNGGIIELNKEGNNNKNDKRDLDYDKVKINNNQILNKSINNNKRHTKYQSMKLDDYYMNKLNKKKV